MAFALSPAQAQPVTDLQADIAIYGGTSAGVIAASAARKCGKTDTGNKGAITGLSRKFYQDVGARYGINESWNFEPHVAQAVYERYLHDPGIRVLLDMVLIKAEKKKTEIRSITINGVGDSAGRRYRVHAGQYLDCTYEGDLLAKAHVSFTLGRESNAQYGETIDGVQLAHYHQFPDGVDPYRIPGDPASGLVWGISRGKLMAAGTGDKKIQAYNFRICLTDSARNSIPITRPEGYDSTRYELLVRLIRAQPKKRSLNQYFIWSRMPNRKTDVNNRGGFSTDMIGANYGWPTGDYATRQKIFQAHLQYTKGLLYFWGHDPRVPEVMRREMLKWGYPRDEYPLTDHFTPALYVREGRRMIGEYVMTEHNCRGAVTVDDGVAMASYNMDSHNCQRIVVNGMVKNEGDVEVHVPHPFPVSYRSLTPRRSECTNLLVPVCLSATHIAYGSIRMEPVFMELGQAAAVAAALAIHGRRTVQQIDVSRLVRDLRQDPYLEHYSRDK